jgi:hypothetical protein
MEPAGQGLAIPDGCPFPSENQKGGLEGILGILMVLEDTAADAHHHGTVPLYKHRKGCLIVKSQEVLEQFLAWSNFQTLAGC